MDDNAQDESQPKYDPVFDPPLATSNRKITRLSNNRLDKNEQNTLPHVREHHAHTVVVDRPQRVEKMLSRRVSFAATAHVRVFEKDDQRDTSEAEEDTEELELGRGIDPQSKTAPMMFHLSREEPFSPENGNFSQDQGMEDMDIDDESENISSHTGNVTTHTRFYDGTMDMSLIDLIDDTKDVAMDETERASFDGKDEDMDLEDSSIPCKAIFLNFHLLQPIRSAC